jgi:16S rRNA (uracil1498-N3)-methyltransferase
MKRALVPVLPALGTNVVLDVHASHHLLKVCRLARGQQVGLFDGTGHCCTATLVDVVDGLAVVLVRDAPTVAAPRKRIHLILGLPKGPATDDAIRMATEAGTWAIHPVWARRTQGRPNRLPRWRRIASSAAAQCGRADVPTVHPPAPLADTLPGLMGLQLRVAIPGAETTGAGTGDASETCVAIGPEGGWSTDEVDAFLKAGAIPMGLGDWVLRTPTAVAVAISLAQH